MTIRPIIFSTPMIKALLAGRKTVTRRVLRFQYPPCAQIYRVGSAWDWRDGTRGGSVKVPYAVGDLLWVREAWAPLSALKHNDPGSTAIIEGGFYRADDSTTDGEIDRWRPSIHMPRWASRLTLAVTDVRVQRLQEISEDDAAAEGVIMDADGRAWGLLARDLFAGLWLDIHGPGAWEANPWVVALTFTVHHRNVDAMPRSPEAAS